MLRSNPLIKQMVEEHMAILEAKMKLKLQGGMPRRRKSGRYNVSVLKYGQPVYLKDKLHPYTSSRNTRRSSPKYKFLQVPSFDSKIHKSHKYLTKSFSHHAPAFWNSLPVHVRTSPSVTSFRKHLKTHLFKSAFPT